MSKADVAALETRLGHEFKDKTLLERALTHSSLSGGNHKANKNGKDRIRDLERLEFLGDRVLGLLTAEELWRRYPDYSEGDMAPRLNALVRKETCAKAALHFGVDEFLKMSTWEEDSGGRKKKAILGDACEALLGALYVDGGLDAARGMFDGFWTPNLEALARFHRDAKTALQEWAQARKLGAPHYRVLEADGPDHAPDFTIEVQVKGFKPAVGDGPSKRKAQMAAAEAFLRREGAWSED